MSWSPAIARPAAHSAVGAGAGSGTGPGAVSGAVAGAGAGAGAGDDPALIEIGRRVYREGVSAAGVPLSAVQLGDQPAALAACAACHRRSGAGSSEGGRVVPGITGTLLFAPGSRADTTRPAYTDASLGMAIRAGVDPGGRALEPLMPRYDMDDATLRALTAYLRTLGSAVPPGVDDRAIHFGVVVGADADPSAARDMVDILTRYADAVNAETSLHSRRARGQTPSRSSAFRRFRHWQVDVWRLDGPADDPAAQLERLDAKQPVFALLSGLAGGDWAPIHRFCAQHEVPCVLPNTEVPVLDRTDFYNVYFSRGAALDGEVLARHLLAENGGRAPRRPVLQVYAADAPQQTRAAEAFRLAMAAAGRTVQDLVVDGATSGLAAFWRGRLDARRQAAVVWWAPRAPVDAIAAAGPARVPPIYVSLRGRFDLPVAPASLAGRVYGVYPYALPDAARDRLGATRVWLRNRKLDGPPSPLQADTLYAATLVADAMSRYAGGFSREALIEQIEAGADMDPVNPAFRPLSFGANSRYGSKGAYVIPLPAWPGQPVRPIGGWIVPE
jgi:Cytochrome c